MGRLVIQETLGILALPKYTFTFKYFKSHILPVAVTKEKAMQNIPPMIGSGMVMKMALSLEKIVSAVVIYSIWYFRSQVVQSEPSLLYFTFKL